MTQLVTERLWLRRFSPHEGPALVALDSDPEVVRYAEPELMHAPRTLADVQMRLLPEILAGYEQQPAHEWWAVVERSGAAFLGWVLLVPCDDGRPAWELGYRLRRSAWGKGYATEAARAALEHGFCTVGLACVVAYVDPANSGSAAVARKLGMARNGIDHEGNDVYEQLREEWPCG